MQTIAQLATKNKRQSVEAIKRKSFEATVDHLVKVGQLDSAAPLAERVHAVLLANRPGAASELPAPVLVQTSPASFIVSEAPILFDLLISVKKFGSGSRSRDTENVPILWIKAAGQEKRPPKSKNTTMAHVVKFLQGYELVGTEVRQFEIIKKYRKVAI